MVKNLSANAGATRVAGSGPGSGRSPEAGNGSPLRRGAWWAAVHGVTKSKTRLSMQAKHSAAF